MLKNKICVIFTGGTIGSSVTDGTVDLDGRNASLLINNFRKDFGDDVAFDELYPVGILSENIQRVDLDKMAECVQSVNCDDYDGIIITHGTDTLCFTANWFSRLFSDVTVPIVFVSALYPLGDERSNGADNFAAAVTFIAQGISGVFVSFKNPYEPCKIHLASRLTSAEQLNGKMNSILSVHFGEVYGREFRHNANINNPTENEVRCRKSNGKTGSGLCNDIVVIKARALLDFSFYRFDNFRPKAVVIELYHSGTVCTAGWDTNFSIFLDHCTKLGIEVVLSPVDSKANVYASARNIAGKCTFAYDMSFEMTVVKVMSALGNNQPIKDILDENRFFEKI